MLAAFLVWGTFSGLTARDLWVDAPVVLLAAMLCASALGLLRNAPWALALLRACASIELLIGLVAFAGLALSVSYLFGTHSDIGRSGALSMTVVIALLLPYLVVYPALQLIWVYSKQRQATAPQ